MLTKGFVGVACRGDYSCMDSLWAQVVPLISGVSSINVCVFHCRGVAVALLVQLRNPHFNGFILYMSTFCVIPRLFAVAFNRGGFLFLLSFWVFSLDCVD